MLETFWGKIKLINVQSWCFQAKCRSQSPRIGCTCLSDLEAGDMSRSVSVTLPCPPGVASNPLNQQPAMSAGLVSASPITFPEEQDDPRVSGDVPTRGGIWGFFKVSLRS